SEAVAGGIGSPPITGAATDQDLVRKCRQGDERAWALLVERFARYVYAIVVQAYRLREHDAEDVFQEVFARAYERLGELRSDEAIRPWIGQLTRRLAIDRLRLAQREQSGLELPPSIEAETSQELERLELALGVRDAMATLPENCQE